MFGIGNFLAMTAAAIITAKDRSSIWCTFAAFLSLIIVAHYVQLFHCLAVRAPLLVSSGACRGTPPGE